MATVTFPFTLTAGQPENVNQLNSNLAALLAGVNLIDLAQMNANSVGTSQLVAGAVTTAKLATNAVTANELADNSVDTAAIVAGNVTKAKLATDALQTFLQLGTAATAKVGWGSHAMASGFGGANRKNYAIPHGLSFTPSFAIVVGDIIGSGNTSTGQNEPVIVAVNGWDATNITVYLAIANGATAAVGCNLRFLAIG